MTGANVTSTGHDLSAARWLDTHFESARPEYEAALRQVGMKTGGAVLDAGCGNGGFLPILCELVGPDVLSRRSISRPRMWHLSSRTSERACYPRRCNRASAMYSRRHFRMARSIMYGAPMSRNI